MKSNIAFLLRYWPVYGGGETVTIILANEMVKRGYNVHIVYMWNKTRERLPFIDSRINAHRISDNGKELPLKSPILSSGLAKIIREESLDFVINQHWDGKTAYNGVCHTPAILIKCHHINVISADNSPMPLSAVHDAKTLLKWLLGHKFRNWTRIHGIDKFYCYSDYVIFLAPSYLEQYKSLTHINYDASRLLAFFNPQVFETVLPENDYDKKKNIALFVGRINEAQKRLTILLNIWKKIESNTACNNWKLVIVGNGEDYDATIKYAHELGIHRISFEGFQNPKSYYEKSRIFMMTSKLEGLPMTLIEAKQNLMCPIVMNTFESLQDVLTDQVDGLIVPDDEQAFIDAFLKLVSNDSYLQKLSTNTSNIGKFSVRTIVDEWEELFKRATKKNR